ncbi:uncharacterized protein LOC116927185 [Daphnia magna]|uniref:MARVEL domain-containing protein n=1 Tax=Daphnia magna TaxID=35525 RepID=A0ABR0AN24_9CRUS|nr:uncharacterized protein LOC116927185 [Daphnia magna]KAK4026471.1 hypothetical protein OUZ56_015467 [Daphnia magna]
MFVIATLHRSSLFILFLASALRSREIIVTMAFLLKMVSVSTMVVGFLAIFFQTCELIVFRSANNGFKEPDVVSAGIWGGFFLVLFSLLLLNNRLRDTLAIQGLAVYGILVGITIIGLYSWSVSRYQSAIPNCGNINISNVTLCGRVALDSLLIFCGILAVGLNAATTILASTFTLD